MVEPPEPDPKNLPNRDPGSDDEPEHTNGLSQKDDRYLRSVVENSSEIVKVFDHDGTLRYANPAFGRIFGYDPEDAVGKMNVIDYVHPDDLPHVLEQTEKAVARGGVATSKAEYRFRHADGSWRWVESVGTYLLDGPVVRGVAITVRDVTKRRESEERFRSQSRELALLHRVRTAVAGELEVPGVLSRAMEAVAEAYGYTRLSAYLLEDGELVPQHQVGYREVLGRIPLTKGVCARAVRAGRPLLVEDVSADPDFLGSIDGVTSEICVPLFDEGEAVGFLNVESLDGVKLTEDDLRVMVAASEHVDLAISRARLYARVRCSEERYRALTQNSSDLVTVMETTGIVRYQSPAIERMLGYSSEELLGKNAFDYVHPDDLQRVEMAFAEGLKDPGRQPSAEYRFRRKDGSWRWLESVGTNLTQEPGVDQRRGDPR